MNPVRHKRSASSNEGRWPDRRATCGQNGFTIKPSQLHVSAESSSKRQLASGDSRTIEPESRRTYAKRDNTMGRSTGSERLEKRKLRANESMTAHSRPALHQTSWSAPF